VLEAVTSQVAETTAGLTIRRGVGLAGVEMAPGTTDVTGVRTVDGDLVQADLVVAATGRRSGLTSWLVEAGARPALEEEEDSGFVYYGRHYRSADGSLPTPNPVLDYFGSIGLLVLPGDNGTWGVGIIASSEDAVLRKLRHEDPWQAVMQCLPAGDTYVDGEPISDLVAMAGIEDRWHRYVIDGEPVATGVVPIADAWAATNPTLGRGICLGVIHAQLLRDTVRDVGLEDPRAFALAFDALTQDSMTPWYRSTIWHDRERLAVMRAAADGKVYEGDPVFQRWSKLGAVIQGDIDLATAWAASYGGLFEVPERVLDRPDVKEKLDANPEVPAHGGPSREELLSVVA
jgi:flavin-dependent dehydrogenase